MGSGIIYEGRGVSTWTTLQQAIGSVLNGTTYGLSSGGPVDGAHLTVLVGVLEGLDEAKDLADTAANWGIVDGDVSEDALIGDDEKSTVGVAFLLDQDTVVLGDLLSE